MANEFSPVATPWVNADNTTLKNNHKELNNKQLKNF